MMEMLQTKICAINRHRLWTDGEGVTTLVVFHGCPLRCRYCLNPQTLEDDARFPDYTPEQLYAKVRIDELYFLVTRGGVTFGGGEPALRPQFIRRFRECCGADWKINIETSLNVSAGNIDALLPVVDSWIIDVKDCNPDIYRSYTLRSNRQVCANLQRIAGYGRQRDCLIRLPLIPDYNTDADCTASRVWLESLGFTNFDRFTYVRKH